MHVVDPMYVAPPTWTPILTARLTIRPYEPADAEAFFRVIHENRERLQPAFPARVAVVRTLADARRIITVFQQDWQARRLFVFGIWLSATGEYLGDISLKPTWGQPTTAELGYYLAAGAQGYGYAREALVAGVQFGFSSAINANRLDIRCYADNRRSQAVASYAGFRPLPTRPRLWPLCQAEPEIRHFAFARADASDLVLKDYLLSA